MSWQACAWVDSLEHYLIGPLEFRVLLKLANVANETGTIAFRSKAEIANELGVHQKSVQKALRALEAAVLIKPGDQRLVQHIRADKRPTVYELNFRYKTQFEQPALPWPIDDQNPDKRGSLVIHRPERGSLPGSSGGASTVPHRTIKEQDLSKYQGDHNSEGSPAPTTALRASGMSHS